MKSIKQILIHAGLPKTGSSYLQSALELLEQNDAFSNVSYPVLDPVDDFRFIRSGNGLEIAKLLVESITKDFEENKLQIAFNDLLSKVKRNKKTMLISSEFFSDASPERFSFLRKIMQEVCGNIRVIIFVRPAHTVGMVTISSRH